MISDITRTPRRPQKPWTICGAEGIRTPDPLDANEVRYRTAPQPPTSRQGYQQR
jgi:hypothetical protein